MRVAPDVYIGTFERPARWTSVPFLTVLWRLIRS
jgi:hypothetical protein